ncbi:glycerophosphodiester phosphodiesterase [Paenibacillus sp. 481]|uniref:glycerophosphodiester phosphodiesterase n=1 Tax=Paenibacillus sp. 481 TaxID=2835869 RepID=UPI001E345762|nr:glycerophosphodiester phosphodiesterase [Paenibacillus sp. 481]UHA74191.1 glycerophosphodiester phosphodiesterase [Paenibacillus sp. 481]
MLIWSHRGVSGYAPENTMAAFRKAIQMDCAGIELDIQQTKDGQIIIIHDEDVQRTTNGKGFVIDHLLEDIRRLDAGSWFHPDFAAERLPTLDEFLDLVEPTNMIINIEIKNVPFFYQGIEEKLIAAVKARGMMERIIVSSFDHVALAKMARLEPSIKLGVLFGDRLLEPWRYVQSLPFKAYSVHPHFSFADETFISEFHKLGCKVYAYTVDRPEWAAELEARGIDGIFSNVPDQVQHTK